MRTKVDAALEAAAEEHESDPERAELLHRARRFKTSWIELAESLTRTRRDGSWKRWGFPSFEEYTRVELHLRAETVDKLTGSYGFLQKRAPEVLARDGVKDAIPSYQSVDFLRRAEEKEGAPAATVQEIRKRVLEDAAPANTVARQFKEAVFPADPASRRERDAAGLRNVAKRLRELLGETDVVPKRLAGEVQGALERLLDALPSDKSDKNAAA